MPSSALYEIVAIPSPVNSGVISTLPFSFALITGFLGATLSVTSTFSVEPSLYVIVTSTFCLLSGVKVGVPFANPTEVIPALS